jgi:invasion protein IalB
MDIDSTWINVNAETFRMRLASACLAAGLVLAGTPAFAQTAKLLQKYDDWQVFLHETKDEKVCFAASAPKEMEPKAAKRGAVFFYLTTWQKDGVRNEVSVKAGYDFKPDSTPTVAIGPDEFQLYPKQDKAFMRDPAEERKLLDAMRKGQNLTVKGTSSRGTSTTDSYSLKGLASALKQLETACK